MRYELVAGMPRGGHVATLQHLTTLPRGAAHALWPRLSELWLFFLPPTHPVFAGGVAAVGPVLA